jgi:hypothetical protein
MEDVLEKGGELLEEFLLQGFGEPTPDVAG